MQNRCRENNDELDDDVYIESFMTLRAFTCCSSLWTVKHTRMSMKEVSFDKRYALEKHANTRSHCCQFAFWQFFAPTLYCTEVCQQCLEAISVGFLLTWFRS